jgi:ribonuclease HI
MPTIGNGGLRFVESDFAMSGGDVISDGTPSAGSDLLRRYRTLCEATGIARANRLPLAAAALAELSDLEERLIVLLEPKAAPNGRAAPHPATSHAPPPTGGGVATVFTDGAAEGNPGPGGYCAIVRTPGRPDRELSGAAPQTTNNKMELTAAIVGLGAAIEAGATEVDVLSDSEYVVKGMTQWLAGWRRKSWKTASGQDVKNRDLWEQLAALVQGRPVRWTWIRGHAGHPENERCDAVASAAARRAARGES